MLRIPDPDAAAALRARLSAAGYTGEGLAEAYGVDHPPAPQTRAEPRLLYLTTPETPLNVLARWFLLGRPEPAERARKLLDGRFLEAALACGLLEARGDSLAPAAVIAPVEGVWLASDSYQQLASATGHDHVLGMNPTAAFLMHATPRTPVASTLDLCGGSGLHALLAASRSTRVVTADISPRAGAYARFNAALNGLENIEARTGDTYEPVAGEAFDRILCNPPFVLAPSPEYTYRDNDLPLDRFCQQLVERAADHLRPGGLFVMVAEWAGIRGERWQDRLGAWVAGRGCDAWVLKDHTQAADRYALSRLRETLSDAERMTAEYHRWMEHYKAHGVEQVHGGYVILRRRDGANWARMEALDGGFEEGFSEALLQGFRARDFLASGDGELLASRPRMSPDCRLYEDRRWEDGWQLERLRLCQASGLRRKIGLDPGVAGFLATLDGSRTVADAIDGLAAGVDAPAEQVRDEALGVVRRMLDLGFLLPPEPAAPGDRSA